MRQTHDWRYFLLFAFLLLPGAGKAMEITDDFELSGFSRVVAGYLESDGQEFNGYSDTLSLNQQSLFALQPSYQFSEQLSITGQFIAHSSDDRDSGTEWLYLSYRPSASWQLRVGKLRMPFFNYSDSTDIGYSYPWITPPAQVYNNYLFSTITGGSAIYQYTAADYTLSAEGYLGYFKGDIHSAGSRIDVEAKVNDLRGLVVNLSRNNLRLRLSYHQGENNTDLPSLLPLQNGLQQAGFGHVAKDLNSKGTIHILQTGVRYDTLSSFFQAEWMKTRTEFELAPTFTGYYFTAGFIQGQWTTHLTYAASSYQQVSGDPSLQPYRNSAANNPLSSLANGYYRVIAATPDGSLDSYILGTRWDFRANMALKAEVSWLNETAPRSGFIIPQGKHSASRNTQSQDATLYQLSWEWIF